ncbi:STAS domain-containing protein [Acinetobacter qingfengensis]|uniref:MlaB-like STAS domain-containing protein n=1 Tax=Acinetobacter qingfengensis TaxID=1262585 RepID=A0A1E7R195_9GAMM|nr:STAS domain-containing protein [Acinetobacter qingfengensis]KAA8733291.1 STAS domain-containing protein [Acinetobacter qingfengensis]OEY93078.1 hypothetical protein BJI46_04880 [Acinetobacter qingfengensis]
MAKLQQLENQIAVIGQIDFENADDVYRQGLQIIKNNQHWPMLIDLQQLTHGNTLALAVFIQWLRACPGQHQLKLLHVPAKMQGILRASHLEQIAI